MARPTDQVAGEENPNDSRNGAQPAMRKVLMIDPGFREEPEVSVLRPRILGIKQPADVHDRRNLKFLGFAVILAVLIFLILEIKQVHEAARESGHSGSVAGSGK